MARQDINTSHPLTWEKVQEEFSKINDNFVELYQNNVTGSIIPDADVTYDLGSPDFRFKDLYLSGDSIILGGTRISANANGGITVPGGIEGGYSLIGFSQDNPVVIDNGKELVFTNPENPGWTQGVIIYTDEDFLYPNLVRPQVSWFVGGGGEINSVRIYNPGVNYPATEYGGVYTNNVGELTTDIGFTKIGPDDSEIFTVVDLGNSFGYQFYTLNPLFTYTGFVIDNDAKTVTGSATAQTVFNNILYELNFGLKFNDNQTGLIIDPAVSTITFNGLTTLTADQIRRSRLASNGRDFFLYLSLDAETDSWVLAPDPLPEYLSKVDFTVNFDKLISLGSFQPLWAPQTSVQAIGDSSINGNLNVTGIVTLAQAITLTPGAEPLVTTEGMLATADGVNWDPAGNGSKQLMFFLNGTWNFVSLTPVTPP